MSRIGGPQLRPGEIIRQCVDPDAAETDSDHFMICPVCGQAFDMRELGEMLHHDEPGHAPLARDRGLSRPAH